jgi:hypothetical protein
VTDQADDLHFLAGELHVLDEEACIIVLERNPVDDMVPCFAAVIVPAQHDHFDGFEKFGIIFILQHITIHANGEHLVHGIFIEVEAVAQYAALRTFIPDLLHYHISFDIRQAIVHDHELWLVLQCLLHARFAGICFVKLFKEMFDGYPDAIDDHFVIIDHEY